MPFRLYNAPATFQDMINYIFCDLLDQGLVAYIDDLQIYAVTKAQHDQMVTKVLKRLRDNHLVDSAGKCEWAKQEVEFLGYLIG